MCNLVDHAKAEFKHLGWIDCEGNYLDEMRKAICQNVLELLHVFSEQEHSGSSAPHALNLFEKLAKFELLSPLTGGDSEWVEVADGVFQNRRASRVFKQADRFGGQAYDIGGRVFYEVKVGEDGEPCKFYYTSGDSHLPVVFPYTLTTEYVEAISE
jgi:hypothetical protein